MDPYIKYLDVLATDLSRLQVEKGLAMEVHPDLRDDSHYPEDISFRRDYGTAVFERHKSATAAKRLNQEGYNDRKVRYAGFRYDGECPVLAVAPTTYYEAMMTNARATTDQEWLKKLESEGEARGDRRMYFSQMMAVNAVTISEDGDVIALRRSKKNNLHPLHWMGFAGLFDYTDQIDRMWDRTNPGEYFHLIAVGILLGEMGPKQEGGIPEDGIRVESLGLVDGLTTVNLVYATHVPRPTEEIQHLRSTAPEADDHDQDRVLRTVG